MEDLVGQLSPTSRADLSLIIHELPLDGTLYPAGYPGEPVPEVPVILLPSGYATTELGTAQVPELASLYSESTGDAESVVHERLQSRLERCHDLSIQVLSEGIRSADDEIVASGLLLYIGNSGECVDVVAQPGKDSLILRSAIVDRQLNAAHDLGLKSLCIRLDPDDPLVLHCARRGFHEVSPGLFVQGSAAVSPCSLIDFPGLQSESSEVVNDSLERGITRQRDLALSAVQEQIAMRADHHDHTQAAELATQELWVEGGGGAAKLLVEGTKSLEELDENVTHVFIIMHGVMRNAKDYLQWFLDAVGDLPPNVAVFAPQFNADVDMVDALTLCYGFNAWRGGEPANLPLPPISSFEAMDALIRRIGVLYPNLQSLDGWGNSEGGQLFDRWAQFSGPLKQLEMLGVNLRMLAMNAGTVLQYDDMRPGKLLNPKDSPEDWEFEWNRLPAYHAAMLWPYGMTNAPPVVKRFLRTHPLDTAIVNYMNWVQLAVGDDDKYRVGEKASHLPVGVGPDEQGPYRLFRSAAKAAWLRKDAGHLALEQYRLLVAPGHDHDGARMLKFMVERYLKLKA